MGIGIALGAAAKSGLDTYERLAEEKRRKTQEAREEAKYQREEAIRRAAGEVVAPGQEKGDVAITLTNPYGYPLGDAQGQLSNTYNPNYTGENQQVAVRLPAAVAGQYQKAWKDYMDSAEGQVRAGIERDEIAARKVQAAKTDATPAIERPEGDVGVAATHTELAPRVFVSGQNLTQPAMAIDRSGVTMQDEPGYYRDLAMATRQFDPQQAASYLSMGSNAENAILSRNQMKRQERYDARKEKYLWLRNTLPAAENDPNFLKKWLKEAADLGTQAEHNGAAGWKISIDGKVDPPMVVMENPVMGQKAYRQMTPKEIAEQLGRFLTPDTAQYYEQRDDRQKERKEDVDFRNRHQGFLESKAYRDQLLEAQKLKIMQAHYAAIRAHVEPSQRQLLNSKEGRKLLEGVALADQSYMDAVNSGDPKKIMAARIGQASAQRSLGAFLGKVEFGLDKGGKANMDPAMAAKIKIIENDQSLSADEKMERIDALTKGDPYENAGQNLAPPPKDVKVPKAVDRNAPVPGTSQSANEAGVQANIARERAMSVARARKQAAINDTAKKIEAAKAAGDERQVRELTRALTIFGQMPEEQFMDR